MTRIDRRASLAGILGGVVWLFAFTGFVFGEIEYADPTRPSPIPEWTAALALSIGAVLIGIMLLAWRREEQKRGSSTAGISVALVGTAVALVPLWPMIFFGPLLFALGMAGHGVAAIRRGEARPGSWIHAGGVPLGIALGIGSEALGIDGSYPTFIFAFAVCGGLIWLAYDMMVVDRGPAPLTTRVDA